MKLEESITKFKLARMFDLNHLDYDGYEKLLLLQEERMNRMQATGIPADEFTPTNYNLQVYIKMAKNPNKNLLVDNILNLQSFGIFL